MSDNVLRFVAIDPDLLPDVSDTEAGRGVVSHAFPLADRVEVNRHDGVQFIDCGSNLESVRCPACGTDLLHGGTWMDLMDTVLESDMCERHSVLPCCGAHVPLENLDYHWPVGFGRFSIEAWNPGVSWFRPNKELGEGETALLRELSAVIGSPSRAFWAHI